MESKNKLFTIGEFSRITGIGIHSLRYYDDIGALKPEYVDPVNNYRYYSFDQLSFVPGIKMCTDAGIRLSEFEDFIDNGELNYRKIISDSSAAVDRKIEKFRQQKESLEKADNLISVLDAITCDTDNYVNFDGHPIWMMPFPDAELTDNESDILVKLSSHARRRGCQISPAFFGLLRMNMPEKSVNYAFAALESAGSIESSCTYIHCIDPGRYLIRESSACSLEEASIMISTAPDCDSDIIYSFVVPGRKTDGNRHFVAARCL